MHPCHKHILLSLSEDNLSLTVPKSFTGTVNISYKNRTVTVDVQRTNNTMAREVWDRLNATAEPELKYGPGSVVFHHCHPKNSHTQSARINDCVKGILYLQTQVASNTISYSLLETALQRDLRIQDQLIVKTEEQ